LRTGDPTLKEDGMAGELTPFNPRRLEDLSGGDRDFERELIRTYRASARDALATLTQALLSRNRAEIQQAAHKLKGMNSNLGAEGLAGLYQRVLDLLSQDSDFDAIEACVAEIEGQQAALEDALHARANG